MASKLRAIGVDGPGVAWFESYLSDREQYVDANGGKSACKQVTCGVPQGSILGPLLFTLYVNDMKNSVNCDLYLYADDSALVVGGRDATKIEQTLSKEMENLSIWLEQNKLSLHLGKTESILFASKRKLSHTSSLSVSCNSTNIEAKD